MTEPFAVACADVREWRRQDPLFHAILCDPPYAYRFMGAKWDSQIAFQSDVWAALAEHLHPGGFVFAFGGARTYHRLAVALEDAGLVLHPCLGWLYGQGFCKSTRIDTQVDRAAGAQREVVAEKDVGPDIRGDDYHRDNGERMVAQITKAATQSSPLPSANGWQCFSYRRPTMPHVACLYPLLAQGQR